MSTADDAMLQECLQLAQEVAREAGRMIREAHERRADESVKIESKGSLAPGNMSVDLVTETDKACEDYIIGTLKKRFPSHAFIGEESS